MQPAFRIFLGLMIALLLQPIEGRMLHADAIAVTVSASLTDCTSDNLAERNYNIIQMSDNVMLNGHDSVSSCGFCLQGHGVCAVSATLPVSPFFKAVMSPPMLLTSYHDPLIFLETPPPRHPS